MTDAGSRDTQDRQEKTGILPWLDARLPVVSAFRREYVDYRTPRNLNGLWNFGAILTVVLLVMLATGIFLAINYTPTAAGAFASIEAIERQVPSGWLLRSIHVTGASMFLAALYIHLFRGLYYGSYKAPREMLWLTGLVLLAMVMFTAFAGYVLPWGQMSYWGADVAGKAVDAVPVVGPWLEHFLQGGDAPGDVSLHRFFILHMVLAFAVLGVVGVHVAALHVTGSNNPLGIEPTGPRDTVPFHPYYTSKDALGLILFALLFAVVVFFLPNVVFEAENFRPANPLHTPADIEPEWYFLPFYGILQSVPSKFGGLLASVGAILVLFLVPWLDRSPIRSARFRPLYRVGMGVLVVCFILLGFVGRHHAQGGWMIAGRIAVVYYFAHFLVLLPLSARWERGVVLPESIAGGRGA
ncbi:cytochrome b [Gluconacetobacter sp. 1b LMG 1731]|uniref:Cytochrome b n=1 Tax=Gluconacetobacter dulcium TaxID=2729096 RepID=A0A7W4IMP5_9PROT|nr:cytochrome b N-terminal domain-containing protein [Gluconacetobacter dulcium]MBB2165740.1 cytochrome b [Gluconacetobacter dulcium]MBB2194835.1 cytochrome b [Gluconacetobacter dulcium]MBB2198636.1 cytochrome b [Gluconacetobacter dulcium]